VSTRALDVAIDKKVAEGVIEKAERGGNSEISPLNVICNVLPDSSKVPEVGNMGQESGAGSLESTGELSHISQIESPV
jgi:hypothetical protein